MPTSRTQDQTEKGYSDGDVKQALLVIAGRVLVWAMALSVPALVVVCLHLWSLVGDIDNRTQPIAGDPIRDILKEVRVDHRHCGKKWHNLNEEFHIHQADYSNAIAELSMMIADTNAITNRKIDDKTQINSEQITEVGRGLINLRKDHEVFKAGFMRIER